MGSHFLAAMRDKKKLHGNSLGCSAQVSDEMQLMNNLKGKKKRFKNQTSINDEGPPPFFFASGPDSAC